MNAEQARLLVDYFANLWEGELPATTKVLRNVPDQRRDYRPDEKSRSAWELATHLAVGDVWFIQSIIDGNFNADPELEKKRPPGLRAPMTLRTSTSERFRQSSRSSARSHPIG